MKILFYFAILSLFSITNADAQSVEWTYQQGFSQGVSICNGNSSHVETLFTNSIAWARQNGQHKYADGLFEAWEKCQEVHRGAPLNGSFNLGEWINSLGTLNDDD